MDILLEFRARFRIYLRAVPRMAAQWRSGPQPEMAVRLIWRSANDRLPNTEAVHQ